LPFEISEGNFFIMTIEQLYHNYLKVRSVCTDTRKIEPGCLFVALKGERFDGNQFAADALTKGAKYVLVSDPAICVSDQYLLVEDTLKTLQDLAHYYRNTFSIPFLAITGTNGKTTTKELVSTVLASEKRTAFTQGNFNNHIGVPLTLLSIPRDTEIAVIEMGANHLGDIDFLCQIAAPTHGLITNIGYAHLEGFGSLEGVKKTKSELYRYLAANDGTAFVNRDMPHLELLLPESLEVISYGSETATPLASINYKGTLLEANPFVSMEYERNEHRFNIDSKLFGEYNYHNILTAVTIGQYFEISDESIKSALEAYVPSNNRSQVKVIGSNTFYMDAYNANPTSMETAIRNFGTLTAPHKSVVLGSMLEMGDYSESEHQKTVDQVVSLKQSGTINGALIFVGAEFEAVCVSKSVFWFPDVTALNEWLKENPIKNTHFLVKGSRGIRLERLLEAF